MNNSSNNETILKHFRTSCEQKVGVIYMRNILSEAHMKLVVSTYLYKLQTPCTVKSVIIMKYRLFF